MVKFNPYAPKKYFTDLNQRTGNAAVINMKTRQVAATFRRIEHGDNAFSLAQEATIQMNAEEIA